jgi:hypothetical protein
VTGDIFMGVATVVALLIGPVLAVLVTRWIDSERLTQTRRMDVFRVLMRTRRMRLTPEHVGALNLVEIEFHSETAVIDAWKAYWAHLHRTMPPNENEQGQLFRERDALLTKLLHAIATSLKFNIEQLDIFEGGYIPQGWLDDEQNQRVLRALLLDILSGKRGIPVVPLSLPVQNSPFPPPPDEIPSPPAGSGG